MSTIWLNHVGAPHYCHPSRLLCRGGLTAEGCMLSAEERRAVPDMRREEEAGKATPKASGQQAVHITEEGWTKFRAGIEMCEGCRSTASSVGIDREMAFE